MQSSVKFPDKIKAVSEKFSEGFSRKYRSALPKILISSALMVMVFIVVPPVFVNPIPDYTL